MIYINKSTSTTPSAPLVVIPSTSIHDWGFLVLRKAFALEMILFYRIRKLILARQPASIENRPACGVAVTQPSARAPSAHHGQRRLRLVWANSMGGTNC